MSTAEICFAISDKQYFIIYKICIFNFLNEKEKTWNSRLSHAQSTLSATCISLTAAPLGAHSGNTHKAWLLTLPVYTFQWTRGALILERQLARKPVNWAGTVLVTANRGWDVNFVWNFPGKSEFRGRALERVNRIPSFIRPLPEAISSRWKRELRYFLIRCICLNAHF